MPQIKSNYDPDVGPLVTAFVSEPLSHASEEDTPRREKVAMLVDTGASDSAISGRVADRLGLPILGLDSVVGFGSTEDAYQHLADLDLSLDQTFTIPGLMLFRFDKDSDRIQGILGRDVLGRGVLVLDGPNRQFTLTF